MTGGGDDPAARVGRFAVVVSCEHAGRDLPDEYAPLFASPHARAALDSHRGWDPGALDIAERFAAELGAPLVSQRVSRLLVECNRSLGHPSLWSEFSRDLPQERREALLERVWRPHRDAVRRMVETATAPADEPGPTAACAVHVGVHTFTPVWNGRRRATDVGLLYDPRRPLEALVAGLWKSGLTSFPGRENGPGVGATNVHRNRPYRGWTDGLTASLRAEFPPSRYLGFELEVSQALVPLDAGLVRRIARSLRHALDRVPLG